MTVLAKIGERKYCWQKNLQKSWPTHTQQTYTRHKNKREMRRETEKLYLKFLNKQTDIELYGKFGVCVGALFFFLSSFCY